MLRDIHSGKKVSRNIHGPGVQKFKDAVGESVYSGIQDWLLEHFDRQDWVNTTWIAPETWEGTPLMPIWEYYAKILDHDERHDISALLYGCICYTILYDDDRTYDFHRPDGHHKDDRRPFGLSYTVLEP